MKSSSKSPKHPLRESKLSMSKILFYEAAYSSSSLRASGFLCPVGGLDVNMSGDGSVPQCEVKSVRDAGFHLIVSVLTDLRRKRHDTGEPRLYRAF